MKSPLACKGEMNSLEILRRRIFPERRRWTNEDLSFYRVVMHITPTDDPQKILKYRSLFKSPYFLERRPYRTDHDTRPKTENIYEHVLTSPN